MFYFILTSVFLRFNLKIFLEFGGNIFLHSEQIVILKQNKNPKVKKVNKKLFNLKILDKTPLRKIIYKKQLNKIEVIICKIYL